MGYNKPGKAQANEAYLRSINFEAGTAYKEEALDQNKTFLIICEGENTEPYYFDGFPVPSKTVLTIGGKNSKNSLVDYALKLKKDEEYAEREIWCVFDYDVKPDEAATQQNDFNSSIEKAERNGLKVAWSNDAFELWFALHYVQLDTKLTRHQLYPILKEKWMLESFHNKAKTLEFCKGHYDRHQNSNGASQSLAIRRARQLHEAHNGTKNYADQCPCTTVYKLVGELNKYLKQ